MRVTEPTKPAALRITNGIEAKRLIMRSQQQLQQQQQAMQKQKQQQQQQEGIRRKWFVPAAGVRPNQNSSTAGQVDKPRVVMVKTNPMNNMMQQRSQYQQQQQARPNVVVTSSNSNAAAPSSSSTTTHSLKMNGATSSMHGAANYRKGVTAGIKSTTTAAGNAASYSAAGMQNLVGAAAVGGGIQLSTLPAQHLQVVQQLYERLLQNPQQMANLIKTLPPQTGQALAELLRQYAVSSAPTASGMMSNRSSGYGQQQQGTAPKQHNNRSIQIVKPNQQQQFPIRQNPTTTMMNKAQIEAASKRAQEQLVQQNIARARLQVRREFDSMVYKLPVLKAPPPDLFFIPNGNHPAFPYFLGLDLTVQWVLGDKQMFRKPNVKPYRCEECETDFTPSWKAICGEKEGCHLYCEKCVRQAQKRKVCRDYKQQLQRAFQLIKEREKQLLAQAAHQQQQNLQSQHQPHQRMTTATTSNSSTSSSAGATGAPFLQSQRKRTWHVCR